MQEKHYFMLLDLKKISRISPRIYRERYIVPNVLLLLRLSNWKTCRFGFSSYFVNNVLCNLIESDNVVACMDDFLVATEIVEKHLEMLERIFKLLIENSARIAPEQVPFHIWGDWIFRIRGIGQEYSFEWFQDSDRKKVFVP